ncbi:aspartate aminotransferase family protein [Halobacillus sp. Marseille-P3879]|uniref:pyridoxal phosphate-dependent decarboxylase family protein n=1 Tax=Halobacillus sp. Marseille-P3879 TaxID=2045014 RepID=UPI000C7A7B45|nr:aspartate aminotransferase family protein [Halobacillus sp. Marseille-P3879]
MKWENHQALYTDEEDTFDQLFFHDGQEGIKAFEEVIELVMNQLIDRQMVHHKPYCGKLPAEVKEAVKAVKTSSHKGESLSHFLKEMDQTILRNNIQITNPKTIGHLHCPPLLTGIAAELIAAVYNQSMDSWDQSPSASFMEEEMIHWLTEQFQLGRDSGGTFSSGGTQSNYMGLLLARDHVCENKFGHNVQQDGLPPQSNKLKILCSKEAHFTVKKSASQLGLGEGAVVTVETDDDHRMCIHDLTSKVDELRKNGDIPFALVATCGTTDFGSVDPLSELADYTADNQLWYHVDAAYGGALILSDSHRNKLTGIEKADSITVDFHKLFYQPISCGAFLVNNESHFKYLNHHADYLNPKEDEDEGIPHLVNKTVATSRRFDALKLWISLRVVGTDRFQKMIDHTFLVAQQAAEVIDGWKDLEGANRVPELNTVLFRFNSKEVPEGEADQLNREIQKNLFHEGSAFAAKTKVNNNVYLKFTILNPRTTLADVKEILSDVTRIGIQELEKRRVLL